MSNKSSMIPLLLVLREKPGSTTGEFEGCLAVDINGLMAPMCEPITIKAEDIPRAPALILQASVANLENAHATYMANKDKADKGGFTFTMPGAKA